MDIRRFEVKDADALWRLRRTALETDPWSFAESVEELQQVSVEEYGRRIGSGGDGNFVMGAFEGARALGMCGFYPVSYTHLDVYKRQAPRNAVPSLA